MAPKVNFSEDAAPKSSGIPDKAKASSDVEVQRSKKSYTALLVSAKDEDADLKAVGAPKSIHEAAERGNTGFIVRAIERTLDFDINQKDNFSRSALHWAAELNRIQAAEALLDYGIDPTLPECSGRTAVHLAARSGHVEMLETIMDGIPEDKKLSMVNQPDQFGITPVYLALQKGGHNNKAFQWLMDNGGKYNC